jgi:RluA family pseudouridine synthase
MIHPTKARLVRQQKPWGLSDNHGVPARRFLLRLGRTHDGRRLDDVLGDWLPGAVGRPLSKSALRRLVMAGAVAAGGRPLRQPGALLVAGTALEARIDLDRIPLPRTSAPLMPGDLTVLFEDAWLLAVDKPAGLQVHASADPSRPDLFNLVRARLAARGAGDASQPPYLALHHRLDVETSGVLLFAVDRAANDGLARAFADHRIEKRYAALTARPAGTIARSWIERGPLAPVGQGRSARMGIVAGGQQAETRFAVLRRFRSALLIDASPATGRKHQVRAHLAAAGLPILGDARYGGTTAIAGNTVPRVMLHASMLCLRHPVTGATLEIASAYPADFLRLLDSLGPSLDTPRASRYASTRSR